MPYRAKDHTFVVCAYKESTYLEDCIVSLLHQTLISKIIITTSTPSWYINDIANRHAIPVFVNTDYTGEIAQDWNFGYRKAETPLVTIAHQDDIYLPQYMEEMLRNINKCNRPIIAFSDYAELRNGNAVISNHLLNIKRTMLFPLQNQYLWSSKFVRRRILSLGSPICCPSVTYVKEYLHEQIFESGYRSCVDWQAWEVLSRMQGEFVYCHSVLMYHRIHEESATTAIIEDNDRTKEDYDMFCRFWPKCIARIIEFFYQKGESSNVIDS